MACDARQPVSGSPLVPAQGLELSARPPRQGQVDAPQGWVEGRRTEPPIVVDPATNVCIEHTREIIQAFVTPPMHRPTPDSPTDRRERLCAGCRTERDAHAPDPLAHHSWPERVAEKVELEGRMVLAPTLILAIDDFRLFRMQRQSAFSKPRRKSSPQCCGLVFITTVTDRIVGIALEPYVREVPAHPQIERIVQKKVGQEGADDPALRRPSLSPGSHPPSASGLSAICRCIKAPTGKRCACALPASAVPVQCCQRKGRQTTHRRDFPHSVIITRERHPFEGCALA